MHLGLFSTLILKVSCLVIKHIINFTTLNELCPEPVKFRECLDLSLLVNISCQTQSNRSQFPFYFKSSITLLLNIFFLKCKVKSFELKYEFLTSTCARKPASNTLPNNDLGDTSSTDQLSRRTASATQIFCPPRSALPLRANFQSLHQARTVQVHSSVHQNLNKRKSKIIEIQIG